MPRNPQLPPDNESPIAPLLSGRAVANAEPVLPLPPEKLPTRIGPYRILKKLGSGSTSSVYLAFDSIAQREVAVKLFSPAVLQDPELGSLYRSMLKNEASLVGKLDHPHIAQIFDAVINERESYIVTEYVPDGTLDQFCQPETLLPIPRVVELIFKCTRALDFAFHQGVTHRDIKPANILVVKRGESWDIKLTDFGTALMADGSQSRSLGAIVGSPSYMSPEQVEDRPLTHQTDIYSLGVVMYRLLTGRLPYQATSNLGMVYQITHGEAPPPSSWRPDVPVTLDSIVSRAMQKSQTLRYPTWEAYAQDLAQSFRNQKLAAQSEVLPDRERFEHLRALPFFASFDDAELWEVVRFSRWDAVGAHSTLMKEGEPGDFFCFLIEGSASVSKQGKILATLEAGACIGEMAVIQRDQHERDATVTTSSPAWVATMPARALRQASVACRMHFYQAFCDVLCQRLALANSQRSEVN